jgi:glycosyltransferase involved in cell wall biosynthesis
MNLVITMPVYNESDGIKCLLSDLQSRFQDFTLSIIIVNDCSIDSTGKTINQIISQNNWDITLINNETNRGHGPSTIQGLRESLNHSPDLVLAIDGDGHFKISEIEQCCKDFAILLPQILEGVRINRDDPMFRRYTTKFIRFLVFVASGNLPHDANTPVRIYNPAILKEILLLIDDNLLTPNLFISSYARVKKFNILEQKIISTARSRTSKLGTTWNQRFPVIPSKKYVRFCFLSIKQWFFYVHPTIRAIRKNSI